MFLPRYDQNNILKIDMFSDKKAQGIAQNLIKIYFGFGWKFPILTLSSNHRNAGIYILIIYI